MNSKFFISLLCSGTSLLPMLSTIQKPLALAMQVARMSHRTVIEEGTYVLFSLEERQRLIDTALDTYAGPAEKGSCRARVTQIVDDNKIREGFVDLANTYRANEFDFILYHRPETILYNVFNEEQKKELEKAFMGGIDKLRPDLNSYLKVPKQQRYNAFVVNFFNRSLYMPFEMKCTEELKRRFELNLYLSAYRVLMTRGIVYRQSPGVLVSYKGKYKYKTDILEKEAENPLDDLRAVTASYVQDFPNRLIAAAGRLDSCDFAKMISPYICTDPSEGLRIISQEAEQEKRSEAPSLKRVADLSIEMKLADDAWRRLTEN